MNFNLKFDLNIEFLLNFLKFNPLPLFNKRNFMQNMRGQPPKLIQ